MLRRMKLGLLGGLVGVALLASPAWAETRFVARAEVPLWPEPRADSAEVGRLGLGAKVETLEKKRGFTEVTAEGRKGWLRTRWLSEKPLSEKRACNFGKDALAKQDL